jgi:hypothetical protein
MRSELGFSPGKLTRVPPNLTFLSCARIYRNYQAVGTPIVEISNLIASNLDLCELYLENE